MSDNPQLHSSIVSLMSLASSIDIKHPDMGLCLLHKLRHMRMPDSPIDSMIEIAHYIRDEAAQKLDTAFDEKSGLILAHKNLRYRMSQVGSLFVSFSFK